MDRSAHLEGSWHQPVITLTFPFGADHPQGGLLRDWVRGLPDRRWNPERELWEVRGLGAGPDRMLHRAGFGIPQTDLDRFGVFAVDDLAEPVGRWFPTRPEVVLVRPRLLGWREALRRLGPTARIDSASGRIEIPVADLALPDDRIADGFRLRDGIDLDEDTSDLVLRSARRRADDQRAARADHDSGLGHHAARAGLATGIGDDTAEDSISELAQAGFEIPDWFGFGPYPYQRLGILSAVAGHRLIADEMGLGKTVQCLGAAAVLDADRIVVVSPPVMLTDWERAVERSGLLGPRDGTHDPGTVAVIRPGRKEPTLPATGVAIVADSLLAKRAHVGANLAAWGATVLLIDEAHRLGNASTARSEAVERLRMGLGERCTTILATGTPLRATPHELVPLLRASEHLDPIFGGEAAFVERYCTQDRFGRWQPRKRRLPELRRALDRYVWVRRHKDDVLPDLPAKQRHSRIIDVDLKHFRAAHRDLIERIDVLLDRYEQRNGTGQAPSGERIAAWARGNIGLIAPLRRACGLAKIPAAVELIVDWLESTTRGDDGDRTDPGDIDPGNPDDGSSDTFPRPLVVWTFHTAVADAIRDTVAKTIPARWADAVRIIDGRTGNGERSRLVDEFQAGRLGALICQIEAAGVGLTLTRARDALYVETDWTAALIDQADDRIHRIGQTADQVTYTTLIAEGTLDRHIHRIREEKAKITDQLLGAPGRLRPTDDLSGNAEVPGQLLEALVHDRIAHRASHRHRARPAPTA